MRARHLLLCGASVALIPAAAAAAQKPSATSVTFDASPTTIVYSAPTTLSGRLSAPSSAGVAVRLQQDDTRPYGDTYKNSALTTTAANGKYAFSVKPAVNTQYRVVAQTSPPATSGPKLVLVRTLVGVRVSDLTPSRGSRVTFAGSVYPAHDAQAVAIQRRSSTGRFSTVARTTLQDAGDARSTYRVRVRVNRDGVYRVKVIGDSDHVNGYSRLKNLAVHD